MADRRWDALRGRGASALSTALVSLIAACGSAQSDGGEGGTAGGGAAGGRAGGRAGANFAGETGSSGTAGASAGSGAGAAATGSGGFPNLAGEGGGPNDAGAAGEFGGDGGDGGDGCNAPLHCDDGDPCTVDLPDGLCGCTNLPAPDGSACDDGDACTVADACESGVCTGQPAVRDPAVLGELRSFGHEPALKALVAFLGPTRAVHARSGRLTLLALDGDEAEVLDDVPMEPRLAADSIGSMVWGSRPRTFLIPVLENHLAIVSQGRGIDLFDLAGDRLTPSERYGFDAGALPLAGATGLGSRLFTCTSSAVQAWSIDPETLLITAGATANLPGGRPCQELALAPDGQTLFVATTGGLERFDVSAPSGAPVLGTPGRLGSLVADVQVSAEFVAVYEIREKTSGYGDVVILEPEGLEVVATFAAELEGGSVPVGFGLLDGRQLFLQTIRGGDCLEAEASVYALSAEPERLASVTTQRTCASPFRAPSFNSVARGRYAVVEPMHQLVHVRADGSEISPVSLPQQGSFERVLAGGPESVLVHGPASAHRIDLSNPAEPRVSAGGLVFPLELEWLRFDVSSAAVAVVTLPDATSEPLSGPLATLLRAGAGAPRPSGSLATSAAEAVWSASGGSLYELLASGDTSFELRRYATRALGDAGEQTLAPNLEQLLETEAPAELDVRRAPLFEVDVSNGDLVVLERRSVSGASSSDTAVLSVFALAEDAYERRFSTTFGSGIRTSLAAGGGRVAVLLGASLELVDAAGERTPVPLPALAGLEVERLLGLDAERLLLSATWGSSPEVRGVLVLDTQTLSELARYETSEVVTSFATAGDHYVFGAPSAIAVAVPACPSAE